MAEKSQQKAMFFFGEDIRTSNFTEWRRKALSLSCEEMSEKINEQRSLQRMIKNRKIWLRNKNESAMILSSAKTY